MQRLYRIAPLGIVTFLTIGASFIDQETKKGVADLKVQVERLAKESRQKRLNEKAILKELQENKSQQLNLLENQKSLQEGISKVQGQIQELIQKPLSIEPIPSAPTPEVALPSVVQLETPATSKTLQTGIAIVAAVGIFCLMSLMAVLFASLRGQEKIRRQIFELEVSLLKKKSPRPTRSLTGVSDLKVRQLIKRVNDD